MADLITQLVFLGICLLIIAVSLLVIIDLRATRKELREKRRTLDEMWQERERIIREGRQTRQR